MTTAPELPTASVAPAVPGDAPAAPAPVRGRVVLLRVVGLVGTLVLVAFGATSLVVGFFEVRREDTRVLDGAVRLLDVSTDVGDVSVRAGAPGSPVSVTTVRRWSVDEPTVTAALEDGTARLESRCPGDLLSAMGRCDVAFTVTVPPGTTVRVSSSTGDVAVRGATGDVTARTSSGDVRLTDLTADDTDVSTAAGDIRLGFATAPRSVRARTAAGDVQVRLPDDGTAYRVVTDVAVGEATVTVPQDPRAPRLVDVRTAAGDIDVAPGALADTGS